MFRISYSVVLLITLLIYDWFSGPSLPPYGIKPYFSDPISWTMITTFQFYKQIIEVR